MAFRWPELAVEGLGMGGEHDEPYDGGGEVWCPQNQDRDEEGRQRVVELDGSSLQISEERSKGWAWLWWRAAGVQHLL
jgi:hypothetical protein